MGTPLPVTLAIRDAVAAALVESQGDSVTAKLVAEHVGVLYRHLQWLVATGHASRRRHETGTVSFAASLELRSEHAQTRMALPPLKVRP